MAAPSKPAAASADDVRKAVTIRPGAIQDEFTYLPATLSRWINERVEAARAQRLAELDLEVAEATVKRAAREERLAAIAAEGKETKLKPLSEDAANDAVTLHPDYRVARLRLIDATEVKERAQGMVTAIERKADMLVSLGADIRSEKEGDPSIRDRRSR